VKRRSDLSAPRHVRRLDVSYDPEAFGQFSEAIARYFGTARFLVIQTVIVAIWISPTSPSSRCGGTPTRSSC
jgi:uncharacterized membrane protein